MEAGGTEKSAVEKMTDSLQKAIEDLRAAGEDATGEARSRIDSALEQVREVSNTAASRAQEQAGGLGDRLESFRDWIRNATADVLDQVEDEVRKRREQLRGDGGTGSAGGGSAGGGSAGGS